MPAQPQETSAPPPVAEVTKRNEGGAAAPGGPGLMEEAATAASTGEEATKTEPADPEVILFKFRGANDDFLYVGNNKRPVEDRCTTSTCNCDEKERSANLEQFCAALKNVVDCRSKMCPYVVSKCLLSQKEFGVLFSWLELGPEESSSSPTVATVADGENNDNEPLQNNQESTLPPRSRMAQDVGAGDSALFASCSYKRNVFEIIAGKDSLTSTKTKDLCKGHRNLQVNQEKSTETEPETKTETADTTKSIGVDTSTIVAGSDPPAAAPQPRLFNEPGIVGTGQMLTCGASGSGRTSELSPKMGVPGPGIATGAPIMTTPGQLPSQPEQSHVLCVRVKEETSPVDLGAKELEVMRSDSFVPESSTTATTIECRSIRFGRYKYFETHEGALPTAELTELGFVLEVPFSKNPKEMKTIEIPKGAISKIIGNTGKMVPTLILECRADYAKWVSRELGLDGNNKDDLSLFYCPETGAPSQRNIVMLMCFGSESLKEILTRTFEEVYQEVDLDAINKMLIKALPQAQKPKRPMKKRNQEEGDSSSSSSTTEGPTPTTGKRLRKVKVEKRSPVPGGSTKKRKNRDSSPSTSDDNVKSERQRRALPLLAYVYRPRAAAVKAKKDIKAHLRMLKRKRKTPGSQRRKPLPKPSEQTSAEESDSSSSVDMEEEEARIRSAIRELESSSSSATEEDETESSGREDVQ